MTAAAAWILSLMVLLAPPSKAETRVTYPEARETAAEALVRYEGIAAAIVRVAYDPDEKPLFGSPFARARTAVMMLAVVHAESGLRKDVQMGRGAAAYGPAGDCGLAQFNLGGGRTDEGWTCRDLIEDLDKTFRAELHLLRKSMHACKENPLDEQLAVYTSGSCGKGLDESKARMAIARRTFKRGASPERDAVWILPRKLVVIPALDLTSPCFARCGKLLGE